MNVVIKKVYAAYETVDEYSRLGSRRGIFTTRDRADKEAIGIGWYGGTGTVMTKNVIIVDDVVYLLESPTPVELDVSSEEAKVAREKIKASALAKLSAEERRVLGV